jgi:glutathione synthase
VTLFPSLFPRSAWEDALKVQKAYNVVYAKISNDVEWLGKIMEEYVLWGEFNGRLVDVDDFVRQLWDLYKEVKKEGIVQVQSHNILA